MSTSRPNKPNALKRLLQILTAAFAWPRSPKRTSTNPAVPHAAPEHRDDAEWCCHPRHGAFPVRRKFKVRGTSATGYEFVVFQCPAPACGEFVAKTMDVSTGQERILFRGHHFRARHDGGVSLAVQRQPRTVTSLRAATFLLPLALALLLAGAGCSRRCYFVSLQDQEAIALGSDVLLDGKKIGTVTEITRKGDAPGRAAQFVVTAAGTQLKAGTEREQSGSMRLSSASCPQNAPVLESGSTLPTRSPITNLTKGSVQGARRLLYEFYVLHPVLALAAATILALGMAGSLFVALCRRTVIALIVALIALALFLCAGAIGHAQTVTTLPGQRGVLFTRDFLRQELSVARRHLSEGERAADTAGRLLDSRLMGDAAAELVRAFCLLDASDVMSQGYQDRIAQLKSAPFSYVKSEEQGKLSAAYIALREQLQNAQARAAMLRQDCTSTNKNETAALQVFMAKRESFRERARAGNTDPTAVLEECRRLAAVNKTEADLARLKQQVDADMAQLRWAKEDADRRPQSTPTPVTLVLTNEIRTVVEKTLRLTNEIVRFVTNTERVRVFITNSIMATTVPEPPPLTKVARVAQATNISAVLAVKPTNARGGDAPTNAQPHATITQSKATPTPDNILAIGKASLPLIGLIGICGLLAAVYYTLSAARTGTVQLALDGKILPPVEVNNTDDVIILEAQPCAQPRRDSIGRVHLTAAWWGTVLCPAEQTVLLNDIAVTKPRRIHRGDTIGIKGDGEAILHKFDFLGWDGNSSAAEG
jgi:hypothetical protein